MREGFWKVLSDRIPPQTVCRTGLFISRLREVGVFDGICCRRSVVSKRPTPYTNEMVAISKFWKVIICPSVARHGRSFRRSRGGVELDL